MTNSKHEHLNHCS